MATRNVVCIANLDPELEEWAKEEAARQSEATGKRVPFWRLIETALREYREKVIAQR